MSTPLESAITTAAGQALRLRSRNNERQGHSLRDLIEADKYLSAIDVVAEQPGDRVKAMFFRLKPPGTV